MELTWSMFLIVCPLVFLAGFVDAIGGGGGLISLPAYFLAGVPVHHALATNKMSSASGTLISTIRLCRNTVIRWKLAIPAVLCALTGSYIGTRLTMPTDERIWNYRQHRSPSCIQKLRIFFQTHDTGSKKHHQFIQKFHDHAVNLVIFFCQT